MIKLANQFLMMKMYICQENKHAFKKSMIMKFPLKLNVTVTSN